MSEKSILDNLNDLFGKKILLTIVFGFVLVVCYAQETMIANIIEPVETDFGAYVPYLVEITPDATQYQIEPDFSNVVNFNDFNFNDFQKDRLLQNGFVVIPGRESGGTGYKEMYDIYNESRESNIPQFITTDAVLHTFHKLYDKILMTTEEEHFISYLQQMDYSMFYYATVLYSSTSDEYIKQCLKKLVAYYSVPLIIFDEGFWLFVPSYVADIVNQEITLIEAQQGYTISPLFNAYFEDYSQYIPRGHYTLSEELEKYFKAMMWHGRQTFCLFNAPELGSEPRTDLTGAALALVNILENSDPADSLWTYWNNIYIPTKFFVGKADDILPQDYLSFAEYFYGDSFSNLTLEDILIEDTVSDFIIAADNYFPEPLISTATPKGMRFMGQRFIPDSYILDQLVVPYVSNRYMPKSLDVLAVLGSDEAYNILEEIGETSYPGYIQQLAYLKDLYENYPDEQWAENLYWNWLYCLMPLLFEKGDGFPPFMQNLAWLRKDIDTALGSWTELRHDTILYAKQSVALGVPPVIITQGYIEPNPYLFARLASLAKLMREGLINLSLLTGLMETKITQLEDLLLNLKSISEKELTHQDITMDEYIVICNFGKTIEGIVTFDLDYTGDGPDGSSQDQMPVIADVHTDMVSGNCLEEGSGYPFKILVITEIEDELIVSVGGIFSYYEFEQPITNRLTDEQWRGLLISYTPPELPYWTAEFMDTETSLLNTNPEYYYFNNLYFAFSYMLEFSDDNPQPGDDVTLSLGLPAESTTVTIENAGIEPFILEMIPQSAYTCEGTFSTDGMSVGKIYVTIDYSYTGMRYRENIILGNVATDENIPVSPIICQNYPNPFTGSTTITFNINSASLRAEDTEVKIYNIKGQLVKTLTQLTPACQSPDGIGTAGRTHYSPITNFVWDGADENGKPVPNGIYLLKFEIDGKTAAMKKCLLIK